MNPTQNRILQYLKSHPASAASAIALALGMTTANIRYHLNALELAGLIEVKVSPLEKGRGHPAHLYHLSLQAQPHHLDGLVDILMAELFEGVAPDGAHSLAERMAERLIQQDAKLTGLQLKQSPLTQRLTALAQSLAPFHYQARWEAHAGSPHFLFSQCPYRAVIDRHPVICQMDAYLLEKLLSRPVRQVARIGQGVPAATTCIFAVELQRAAA
jgi:predicted ArsR family transcriptional regulator